MFGIYQPIWADGFGNEYQKSIWISYLIIATPIGFMSGSYRMILENGEQFDAEIPQFRLIAQDYLN